MYFKSDSETTALKWEQKMTARHKQQHEELLHLADAILGKVSDAHCVRSGEFTRLRLQFARALIAHCEEEAVTFQTAVARGVIGPEIVSGFHRELVAWRADLAITNGDWAPSRALDDPQGFRRCFAPIVKALHDYIAREDRDVLAVIDQHQ